MLLEFFKYRILPDFSQFLSIVVICIQIDVQQNFIIAMSILKRQEFIQKSFFNYFSITGRIMFELNELVQLLKLQPNPHQILQKLWLENKELDSIIIFKWLILLNKMIMEFVIEPMVLTEILDKVIVYEKNDFDNLLNKKLIKPYKLYLMKRCQFLPKKSANLDRMYQLMNLIQTGTCFSEIIYTLGRYYSKKYPFAADFNIVLGNDLHTVYNQMVKYTPKPASCEILEEYQKIHEKMYIIYYNCYYYKYLKPFVPRWVVTDTLSPENKSILKTPETRESIKSNFLITSNEDQSPSKNHIRKFKNVSVSSFDMSRSAVFQIEANSSKKFEESLMLLKSMERVFEELQQI